MNGFPNEPQTANALPVIISKLKNRGFKFVKLSELFDIEQTHAVDIKKLFKFALD